ncbi:MAG: folate family ECF transporter S component [Clostridia bacterium]|nr:folate family ECF transporter S component [Clostridia bacterium]
MQRNRNTLYPHPFSRAYWRDAAAEFRDTRMLMFAALMIALRVGFKAIKIPVGPYLDINSAFVINAMGAMCFGPVVAIAAAAITDTLGCILVPSGPWFPPFVLTEIAGSLIFALFLYRARVTVKRVVLSRFCVSFFVNLVLQTPIMVWYNQVMLGKGYVWLDLPRIIKNLALFPFEALILVVFLRAAMPPLEKGGMLRSRADDLTFNTRRVIGLVCLSLFSVGIFIGGSIYLHNTVSLSASYTPEERREANAASLERVLEQDPSLAGEEIVAVVDSAFRPFLSGDTTWTVSVYRVDAEMLERMWSDRTAMLHFLGQVFPSMESRAQEAEAQGVDWFGDRKAFKGYSKSSPGKHPALKDGKVYTVTVVTDGSGKVLKYEKQ